MIHTDGIPTIANAPRGTLDAILAEDAARREAEAPLARARFEVDTAGMVTEHPADCDPGDCTD